MTAQKPLILILAIATALRIYRLDTQLWLDEILVLVKSVRQPLGVIITDWSGTKHVLIDVLAHMSIQIFGEHPWSMRLPAALFGIAGVAAVYAFVASTHLGRRRALVAAGLMTFSYHHVFYSQNARGYTALMFFSVICAMLIVRFARTQSISRSGAAIYAVCAALATASQIFGAVIAPAHWLLAAALRRRLEFCFKRFTLAVIAGSALGLLICLPLIPTLGWLQDAAIESAAPERTVNLRPLLRELFDGLFRATRGPIGFTIAAALAAIGLIDWYRRDRIAAAVLIAPIALQTVVLLPLTSFAMHPRAFAMALPVAMITASCGLVTVVDLGVDRLRMRGASRRATATALLAVLIALSGLPLVGYTRAPKQDFTAAIARLDVLAEAPDKRVAIGAAAFPLTRYYETGDAAVQTLEELVAIEAAEPQGAVIWLTTTLERSSRSQQPDLWAHIDDRYDVVDRFRGTLGDGTVRVYRLR